ncbi:Hemolysin activation/secretion protein [Solimonas aquatica]|uniref:Hemolysin activation/secretion protein n=1 Tax=Solimonas aquatica TaxID=489703 RepID=A0A1H9I6R4_9GAMM|nr:ShlB/FhaC/HecB family hemolysin secretion/activation protein [Solimonas aquatica]SEQ70253.1 Hemolysin activation/secretion protein [Solimonas aquatica]
MPVDLPPPALPAMKPVAQLQAATQGHETLSFQDKLLHLSVERSLYEGAIAGALHDADSLEAALASLEVLYYRNGYPAARVYFAIAGHDVFIVIRAGWISSVRDESGRYLSYFRDLAGRKPLRDTDLAPRLTLASAQADRAGEAVALDLQPAGDGGEILVIHKPSRVAARGKLRADLNNFGTRYAGRYQGSVSARYALASGDQASLAAGMGLRNLGDREPTVGPYHTLSASFSHVGRLGIFDLGGDYARAQARPGGQRLNQQIERWGGSWSVPLHANLFSQFNLQLRGELFRKNTRDAETDAVLQDERYPAVSMVPAYARVLPFESSRLSLKLGTELQAGLGKAHPAQTDAKLDYYLLRPALALQYFRDYWDYSFSMTGQLATERLPEQQQWVLGGPGNLYAYLPGAAIGDVGTLLALKLHREAFGYYGVGFEPSLFAEYGVSRYAHTGHDNRPEHTAALADVGAKLSVMPSRFFNFTVSATREVYSSGRDTLSPSAERGLLYFRATVEY